ncbi:MAG: restriction endonuclease subunit S [Lachnospiraceae bacterium]|nr:restriction endonuclease subunit S [Lachnospiraceae bacterium]
MGRAMKDSGVEWIGEIPEEWRLGRIGEMYTERRQKVSDIEYPPLSVTMKGIVPQLSTAAKTDAHDNRKLVCKGDFAINSRSDRRGSCGISAYDGSVSLINTILKPREDVNYKYYDWLFHTSMFADEFYKWGHGIVDDLWTTNWQDMKNIVIPVPPVKEQKDIACYLDDRCDQIDSILEKTQASVEEYKRLKQAVITQAVTKGVRGDRPMKDSGIAWIGLIPEKWHIVNLGRHMTIESGISVGKTYESGTTLVEVPYLRVANVQGDHIDFSDIATILVAPGEAEKYKLHTGQLLMTEGGDRDKLGRGCKWNGEIDNCIHQNHVFAVQTDEELLTDYLDYLTTSDVARTYFDITAKKTTNLACTNKTTIQKFTIPVPPVDEQREICDFLDDKCEKLNHLITQKEQLPTELENYKKSLIYEYVTGKKEVPSQEDAISETIDPKVLLMVYIAEYFAPKGRIHMQKMIYSVECILGLPFGTQYYRYPHGPYDKNIEKYEQEAVHRGWLSVTTGNQVEYSIGKNMDEYRKAYQEAFGGMTEDIRRICTFLSKMKTSQTERVATLLASWNDFILKGIDSPTDDQIIDDVRNHWSDNKHNSPESTWQGTLDKIRSNGFTPKGNGLCTKG